MWRSFELAYNIKKDCMDNMESEKFIENLYKLTP